MSQTEILKKIDKLIRVGSSLAAKQELQSLELSKLERHERLTVSNMARRVGLPMLGLRALRNIIRSQVPIHPPASIEEAAAYASILIRIGAFVEAAKLLQPLSSEKNPEVIFYRTFVPQISWNYAKTIPLLRKYIRHPMVSDYQKLVGQVNLAAALTAIGRTEESRQRISRLFTQMNATDHRLLYGNLMEIEAQNLILMGENSQARRILEKADNMLGSADSIYHLFVRKWQAILDLKEQRSGSSEALRGLRDEAIQLREWEVARDCDLHLALYTHDLVLFNKVYSGSRFMHYRQRIRQRMQDSWKLASSYEWALPPFENASQAETIELQERCLLWADKKMNLTPTQGQLLRLMTSDFYRPFRHGEVFDALNPKAYFNPDTTPHLIEQAVFRLNRDLRESQVPLAIQAHHGAYGLVALAPVKLKIYSSKRRTFYSNDSVKNLREKMGLDSFDTRDAAKELGCSVKKARVVINLALSDQLLLKIGDGKSVSYRFGKKTAA